MEVSIGYREVGGKVRAPSSKSSMQRAVACAMLADGESVLRSPSRSADCLSALGLARALGARVEDRSSSPGGEDAFAIRGIPPDALRDTGRLSLSCGESGLAIRMFSPVAALFAREIELRAEGTLRRRPVGMISGPLAELGAECGTDSGFPPVRVRGPLRGGRARVDGSSSSQFLTGLLIALPLAESDSALDVDALSSRGYVDLTLGTMRAFGVAADRDDAFRSFRVQGSRRYRATDFAVEGDWSGGAFLLAAGAIAARDAPLEVSGLDSSSAQPDRAIVDALRACGASVELGSGGIRVARRELAGFDFDATDCPDLFPPLAVLALSCGGETVLRGASRLRGKESDRAAALSEELGAIGADISVDGDAMTVRGGRRLSGGRIDARGDHRIAMAAAVASLLCEAPVQVRGAECVAKSWPGFFEDLAAIAR